MRAQSVWLFVFISNSKSNPEPAHQVFAHLVEDVVERRLENKARRTMTLLAEAGNLGCKKNDSDLPQTILHIAILHFSVLGMLKYRSDLKI